MSYLEQDDDNLSLDLYDRKEFYWTKQWDHEKPNDTYENIIPRFLLDSSISSNNYLKLLGHQEFVTNFINPHTQYKRLHIKWSTGSGKTIAALSIAMNFINNYRIESQLKHNEIGSVFIIGFSERVFKSELLKYPEFGFINREEKYRLLKLKRIAATGTHLDATRYKDFMTKIKRRFSNRKNNGFFKFYGYKAFVNRIFITNQNINISELFEEEIRELLANGVIKYNEELLKEFDNSLIICDEIHNVYNTLEKNNWGIAIQAVLDTVESVRCVTMSATPLNNSPSEIVDLLNLLLLPKDRIKKSDFFINDRILKPGALERIAKLSKGRFSFLNNSDPKYYPKMVNEGQKLNEIPYLKFIRCPMSDFHYKTYAAVYNGALSQDSQYLVDFVLDNPEDPDGIGIYQTNQIKKLIPSASQKWKDTHGIDYHNNKIIGDFLLRENIPRYSTKFAALLDAVKENIEKDMGKIFIYSNVVHMSGVLLIEQLLLKNGYIDEFRMPTGNSICLTCRKKYSEHVKTINGGMDNVVGYVNGGMDNIVGYVNGGMDNDSTANLFSALELKNVYFIYLPDKLYGISDYKTIIDSVNLVKDPSYNTIVIKISNQIGGALGKILLNNGFEMLDNLYICEESDVYPDKYTYLYFTDTTVVDSIGSISNLDSIGSIISELNDYYNGRIKYKVSNSSNTHSSYKGGKKTQLEEHTFVPIRFIMAHSNIDKGIMEQSLEKFNSAENSNGEKYRILVGSRIIKESYDLKAIQNVFFMERPNNIPTFLQIRGRAIRKNSHVLLPIEKRIVRIRIFTSCLPIKQESGPDKGEYQLSYEEKKYRDKIFDFKVIQQIEKVLHENAVDALINYDKNTKYKKLTDDPLSELAFEIKPGNEISLSELNLSTFTVYYQDEEIKIIKVLIKRLFIELSSVWEYNDLLDAVRNPPINYESEINTKIFDEANFSIALNQLIWHNSAKYIEPYIKTTDKKNTLDVSTVSEIETKNSIEISVLDHLYDTTDKIIMLPGNQENIIVSLCNADYKYFILCPIVNDIPDIDLEIPYRITKKEDQQIININSFVQTKSVGFDYEDKKKIFFRKYLDTSIENMENVICEYGSTFHMKFLEESTEYVFNVWTNPKQDKSEYHEFYFKMLYYYDLLSLVMWGHTTKPRIFKDYVNYAIPVKNRDIKLKALSEYENKKDVEETDEIISKESDNSDLASSGVINLLKTTYNKTSNTWIPKEFRENYMKILQNSLDQYAGTKKKIKSIMKVSANLLPIGHYISKFPKLYHPERGWDENPTYLQNDQEFKENNIIVGFDERSSTGVHIRFKIRNPIHAIKKHRDSRETEKGTVCKSKNKLLLREIVKKLNVITPDKINVEDLCVLIRSKLIRMELIERVKKTNIKYFYFHYEARPETI